LAAPGSDPPGFDHDAAVFIRQLNTIARLATRMPQATRQALAEQAEAIRETGLGLASVDLRDLEAAWVRARDSLKTASPPVS
jgi:hypothetical protein